MVWSIEQDAVQSPGTYPTSRKKRFVFLAASRETSSSVVPHTGIFIFQGDFIEQFGFVTEIHEVVTEDSYVVTMHRVVPQSEENSGRPAVIIQHGIGSSSILWVLSQEKSLRK